MFKILLATATALAGAAPVSSKPAAQTPILGQLVDPVNLRGVEDVYLDGDYAYLPCREGHRFTICSIADPVNPTVSSSFTHPDLRHATGLAINGNTLYLTSSDNHRLLILDATNKSDVRLLGSLTIGRPGTKEWTYKLAYRAGYCYVTNQTEKKLFVVDVKNSHRPVVVGSTLVTTEKDGPFSIALRDNYALIGTLFGKPDRLCVVDVADPTNPQLVLQVLDPAITVVSGTMVGNYYFAAASYTNGFLVFDISDPPNTKLAASFLDDRLILPNRCIVSGDRAYLPLGQGGNGVAVVDIADPLQPKFLTSFIDPVLQKAYGAALRGDLLFVGARDGNSLVVLDRRKLEQ